jgi:putative addiction module component (TIGR02574 family)
MSTDELLAEALCLTRVDRVRVAEELLFSLEESDDEVATGWATELGRRSREVAEGRVQAISWESARTEILKELEARMRIDHPADTRTEFRGATFWSFNGCATTPAE